MKLKEEEEKSNKLIKYRCYECNSLFEVRDLGFDYTDAIYCINCGIDSLINIETNKTQ